MLGQVGVGKGLNIKGKSAKKNKLSGFVPFCQISKNEHKKELENAPSDARTHIFFQVRVGVRVRVKVRVRVRVRVRVNLTLTLNLT